MLRLIKHKLNDVRGFELDTSTSPMKPLTETNKQEPHRTVSYLEAETTSFGTGGNDTQEPIQSVTPNGSVSGSLSSSCGKYDDDCNQRIRHRPIDQVSLLIPAESSLQPEDSPTSEKIRANVDTNTSILYQPKGALVSVSSIVSLTAKEETQNLPRSGTKVRKISVDDDATLSLKPSERPAPKRPRLESSTSNLEASSTSECATATPVAPSPSPMILLSSKQDEAVLSPLHVFVRKQVEVFTATLSELGQPAPGRKQPILLHQVGLRCIHCRHLPSRKRVKRAVCYPSSVGRVYHSVSDMKFDHFPHCKALPDDVREEFDALRSEVKSIGDKKPNNKKSRCSSSTAQYYHDSALEMGMMDCPSGIFMSPNRSSGERSIQETASFDSRQCTPTRTNTRGESKLAFPLQFQLPTSTLTAQQHYDLAVLNAAVLMQRHPSSFPGMLTSLQGNPMKATENTFANRCVRNTTDDINISTLLHRNISLDSNTTKEAKEKGVAATTLKDQNPTESMPSTGYTQCEGTIGLSDPEDEQFLNPLHCFVRKQVEIFTADEADISAPSPGRKTRVVLGQVGVRCIHCAKLPIKERVKRAVCYPPSVTGLYHSISNMKFDHFAICRGLPSKEREEFTKLKTSCNRRSTVGTKSIASASSTAQYYHESAVRKGLEDTLTGIRFRGRAYESKMLVPGATLPKMRPHMHTGISALMMAATHAA